MTNDSSSWETDVNNGYSSVLYDPANSFGLGVYGNLDIILDHLTHTHQLCATLHMPCGVFYVYLVPRLTG